MPFLPPDRPVIVSPLAVKVLFIPGVFSFSEHIALFHHRTSRMQLPSCAFTLYKPAFNSYGASRLSVLLGYLLPLSSSTKRGLSQAVPPFASECDHRLRHHHTVVVAPVLNARWSGFTVLKITTWFASVPVLFMKGSLPTKS